MNLFLGGFLVGVAYTVIILCVIRLLMDDE